MGEQPRVVLRPKSTCNGKRPSAPRGTPRSRPPARGLKPLGRVERAPIGVGSRVLNVDNVTKTYPTPRGELAILNGISLTLNRGDAIAIMGPSGSGKSTLLYLLGALEAPSSGRVTLDGQNPYDLGERQQAAFRNRHIGFIFQDHSLLPQCSVLENVLTPTLAAPAGAADAAGDERRAREILDRVGLTDRLDHRPAELSGGEKQRAA